MIPENEEGVVYLFYRNHERLGFEKIVRFNPNGTPDCIALQNGKEVGIEFEIDIKKFFRHYTKTKMVYSGKTFGYKIKGDYILIYRNETPNEIIESYNTTDYQVWDPKTFPVPPSMLIDSYSITMPSPLVIIFKTLSKDIQYIVCWEKDFELNDNIEVIELKNLNLS